MQSYVLYQYTPQRLEKIKNIKARILSYFDWESPNRFWYAINDIKMYFEMQLDLLDYMNVNKALHEIRIEKGLKVKKRGALHEDCLYMPQFIGKPIIKQFCSNPKSKVVIDVKWVKVSKHFIPKHK